MPYLTCLSPGTCLREILLFFYALQLYVYLLACDINEQNYYINVHVHYVHIWRKCIHEIAISVFPIIYCTDILLSFNSLGSIEYSFHACV